MKPKVCPQCGAELRWIARDNNREAGCCACNPRGPVVECDIEPAEAPAEEQPEVTVTGVPLFQYVGVDLEIAGALVDRGYTTLEQVRAASDEALLAISGIGPARLKKIRELTVMPS